MKKRIRKKRLKMQSIVEMKHMNDTAEDSDVRRYLEHVQRLQAEFDNYRRRVQREKDTVADKARMGLLSSFLVILDTLRIAVEHANSIPGEMTPHQEGFRLILRQFEDFLEKEGVTDMNAEGKPFDPKYHEAMLVEPAPEGKAGMVARELRKGYMYKDVVLRPAQVSVYQ